MTRDRLTRRANRLKLRARVAPRNEKETRPPYRLVPARISHPFAVPARIPRSPSRRPVLLPVSVPCRLLVLLPVAVVDETSSVLTRRRRVPRAPLRAGRVRHASTNPRTERRHVIPAAAPLHLHASVHRRVVRVAPDVRGLRARDERLIVRVPIVAVDVSVVVVVVRLVVYESTRGGASGGDARVAARGGDGFSAVRGGDGAPAGAGRRRFGLGRA